MEHDDLQPALDDGAQQAGGGAADRKDEVAGAALAAAAQAAEVGGGARAQGGDAGQGQSEELARGGAVDGANPLRATMKGSPGGVPYRDEMEGRFGHDFSGVQAFTGQRDDMTRRGARAAASGEVVAFADGAPGKDLVAHELAHVVQQRQAGKKQGGDQSRVTDAAEQEARLAALFTGGGRFPVREAPSAGVMLDQADTWQTARRHALEIKDALLDGWTEDEERALDQIRNKSRLMLREIRAQYAEVTGGRRLESDFKAYCSDGQYREALSLLWAELPLMDRLRSNVDEGWLWDSANEEGLLDVLRSASAQQLSAAAQDPQLVALLRAHLSDDEYYEARKLLTPNDLYPLAVERIRNAPGWWNDDEDAVYDVILELSPGDRTRLWTENQALFSFMSAGEKASVQRMCTGTEADALDERMDRATSGLGTDDDAVADVTARAGEAAKRERVLAVALETGMMPDGSPVTPEVRAQLEAQQAQLGGVQQNLLTAQRDADGELEGESFLGRLHGDVSDTEFQGFTGQMRVDPFERAKQQILDAVGFWNDDEASINDAFETLVGQLDLAEGEDAASLSPQQRQARQQTADRELRERLWNDPDVQAALAHLNRDEQAVAADHAAADTYAIALHDLADAYYGMNTDEAKLLSVVTSMSAPDRERLLAERPRIWNVMMGRMTPDEASMLRTAAETGRVPTDRALDVAMGGAWDGTDEDMVNQVLGAMSVEEQATYRLGYYLQREGVAPEGPVEQDALRRFTDLEARLRGELGDDDLQAAMDKLVGVPGPEELQTDAGRAMSAAILRHRQADKLSVGSGLADAFTDTDETRDQAAVQFESAYAQAMEDGQLDTDEIAVLAHLDARFAERYADHVQTVDLIRNVASTVAAVAVGILVTVLTGGAAGPAVGGFLAQYGAAALAGGVAGAVAKVGTAEVMAGDHYDAVSTEGAADAAAGFADGATAVLSAGLAARFTSMVGLSRGALAAEMTTATLRSASEATAYVGKRAASGAVSGALEGFLAGAVGEMVLTLSDEQTWRQSIWSVVGDAGLALLRGGLLGAATGGVVGGGAEGLSAVVEVRRLPRLVSQLEAAGIPRGEIDDMSIDVAQRVGRADELAQAGKLDEAAQQLDGLQGKVPPDRLAAMRRAIVEPDQQGALAGHADRVTQLQQQGAFGQTTYHGTNSEMLDGLEQTQGRILSAEDLHQQSVTQRTGEGDAFSGRSGRKQFISVGQGEAGLGTSLAYAEAGGKLNHYNVQRYTLQELDDEIGRLQGVVDNFDDIDVQVGGPMAYYTKEKGQFESQLQKLLAERDLRMALPSTHPRRVGGAQNIQNYPVLFEFDATGLDVRARGDVQAGGMLGGEAMSYSPIDLRESLVRAYAPLDKVDEVTARLNGILGHSNFEVIAIEALDALPQQGMTSSTRLATYKGLQSLQDDFVRVQQMYAEAAGSGQTIDVEYLLRHMHGQ